MLRPTAAVLAAAASACLIVVFAPGTKPDTGRVQTAIDQNFSAASTGDSSRIESLSTGTMLRASVEADLQNSNVESESGCVQTWPYYESSCLRASNSSNPRTIRVVIGDRSATHAERTGR